MRRLAALALVFLACSDRPDRAASSEPSAFSPSRGPDAIVLRVPRAGGVVRAYVYPALDTPVFTGPRAPAIDRILAFDAEAGLFAFVGEDGKPGRIDLRLARVTSASSAKNLSSISSANGSDIYALARGGKLYRFAPSGDWDFELPAPPAAVFPQPDGSVLVSSRSEAQTTLWRLRAPDPRILDTIYLPPILSGAAMQAGDRLYFRTDTALIGVGGRDLTPTRSVRFRAPVVAMAATPSGDRIYVATRGSGELRVIDRYSQRVDATVELPGPVSDLRMDQLGRYLLARMAEGDSAWVVAVATNDVLGSIQTAWAADLPAVAVDGAIAVLRRPDVVFLEPESLQPIRTVAGGARDYWYFTYWNGFRARAEGIDRPVTFSSPDSIAPVTRVDSAAVPVPVPAAADTTPPPPTPPPPAAGFTVSFAALLSEAAALAEAQRIRVRGAPPRVVVSHRAGTPVYRVLAGPYPSREEAERVGIESGHAFWVYQGEP